MVEALYIAAKQDKEQSVAIYLQAQLQADTLSLVALQQHFQLVNHPNITVRQVQQYSLGQYDQLLSYVPTNPISTEMLPLLLKELKLSHIQLQWQSFEQQAITHQWSYTQFLLTLCKVREYPALSTPSAASAQGSTITPKIPL